jgi:hypothetical protein
MHRILYGYNDTDETVVTVSLNNQLKKEERMRERTEEGKSNGQISL